MQDIATLQPDFDVQGDAAGTIRMSSKTTGNGDETRARVRQVLAAQPALGLDMTAVSDTADMYQAGMTSRASVSVMLALESEFGIEFPDSMLRRDVFESVVAMSAAIDKLRSA